MTSAPLPLPADAQTDPLAYSWRPVGMLDKVPVFVLSSAVFFWYLCEDHHWGSSEESLERQKEMNEGWCLIDVFEVTLFYCGDNLYFSLLYHNPLLVEITKEGSS